VFFEFFTRREDKFVEREGNKMLSGASWATERLSIPALPSSLWAARSLAPSRLVLVLVFSIHMKGLKVWDCELMAEKQGSSLNLTPAVQLRVKGNLASIVYRPHAAFPWLPLAHRASRQRYCRAAENIFWSGIIRVS
jgi:hypothetical protein